MEFSDIAPFIAAAATVAAILWRVPSRNEMHRAIQGLRDELRHEIENVRDEIQGVRDELHREIQHVRAEVQHVRDEVQIIRDDVRELRVMFTTKLMLNGSSETDDD